MGGDESKTTTLWRKMTLKRPDLYRMEARQGDKEWFSIQDGKTRYSLEVKKNEYAEYPAQKIPFRDVIPAQLFFGENPSALLGSDVKVSKHKDGHAISWVMRGRGNPTTHWLWLNKDALPVSSSSEGQVMDGKTWEKTEEYKFDLDPKIDDKMFVFVPPAGATLKPPIPPQRGPEPAKSEVPKKALEILTKAAAALRAGSALSYEAEVVFTGPYEKTMKLKVAAKQPDRFRVELGNSVMSCDGTAAWSYDLAVKKYQKFETNQLPPGEVEKVLGLYLDPKPELALRRGMDYSVAQDKGIDVISWVEENYPSMRHEFRFDSKTGLPLEWSTVTERDGDTYGHGRKYSAFNTTKEPDAGAFTFTPPEGSSERTAADGDWEGKLLPVGAAALELKGKDPAGKDISLADFKGKAVLVYFGGASRTELRWLQGLHDDYAKRGLMVLGVISEDGAKAMREKFASEKFTFSALSLKESYLEGPWGVRIQTTMYLIGTDGKVAARMVKVESYGYTERNLRGAIEKTLNAK
jgi:outer membrane lipoprotein-sorting protein/peroxiredoxin